VALPDGMQDDAYLRRMHDVIPGILQDFKPSLVLYDAGVDPHKDDELGRLALTTQGLLRRDTMVTPLCCFVLMNARQELHMPYDVWHATHALDTIP
jgi:acetoin utilization deacetylase AcuC-like enzyme